MGNLRGAPPCRSSTVNLELEAAWLQTTALALCESQRFVKVRRGSGTPTGVQAAAALAKASVKDCYSVSPAIGHAQVPFRAALLDEPSDQFCVDMLAALPVAEAD